MSATQRAQHSPLSGQGLTGASCAATPGAAGAGADEYRHLFELAGVGLGQIDPATSRYLRVNQKLCQITGYSEAELLARTSIEITHPEDWESDRPQFERLLRGEIHEHAVEKRYIRKDGSAAWVLVTLNPLWDETGRVKQLITVVRDIDRRKRVEAEVQRRERSLKFLADAATRLLAAERPEELVPALVAELAGLLDVEIHFSHLLSEDGAGLRMLGSSELPEEVRRRVEYVQLGQESCGRVAARREPIVLEHAQQSTEPYAALQRSLGIRAYACYPLLAQGMLMGTLSVATRRRETFEATELELLRAICDQVAMALERRRLTLELQGRARELSEANAAKDQFLAVLSHELRTPLTPVLLATSAMEADGDLPEKAREELAMVRQNIELEARLIDDLLDLTRITQGKLQLQMKTAELHELVGQVVRTVAGEAQARSLTLVTDLSAARTEVMADPARVQQILWNLLKNAIKFTPEGGVVTVRTGNDSPPGAASGSAGEVIRMEVSDTGIGIEAERMGRLFNAFEQGGHSITRRFGGLGLGLAISRALAQAHGGTLEAESAGKGRGAKFTLTLPVASPRSRRIGEGPAESPPNEAEPATAARLRVLLVEDHVATAQTMARLLRSMGHEVEVASSVQGALQAAARKRFDLLISDIGLPDGSGMDLMRELRHLQPMPAIALSGYGMEEDVRRSKEAGFTEHLTKPINLETLRALTARRLPAAKAHG